MKKSLIFHKLEWFKRAVHNSSVSNNALLKYQNGKSSIFYEINMIQPPDKSIMYTKYANANTWDCEHPDVHGDLTYKRDTGRN